MSRTTMTTSSDNPFPQASEPEQRVWALKAARSVVAVNASAFGGTREISPIDLVDLSKYILTGVDPYERDTPAPQVDTEVDLSAP